MPLLFNILAILSALLTAGAYWYGVQGSFFWIYPWYDIMLHLMGGVVMGLWASAVSARLHLSPLHSLIFSMGIVIGGACVWEIFEFLVGFERDIGGYIRDTSADVLNGVIGGGAVATLYSIFNRRKVYVE
jgi:hypothetical protein